MVQRTLTALFSLAVLIFPASHLYADADGMTNVYSGLECQYLDSYAMEGQAMSGGHVIYHDRLGIGNLAKRSHEEADPAMDDMRQFRMSVVCPLPALEMGAMVQVAVIDGTVFDNVRCRIQTCRAGIGLGGQGKGGATLAVSLGPTIPTRHHIPRMRIISPRTLTGSESVRRLIRGLGLVKAERCQRVYKENPTPICSVQSRNATT